MATLFKWFIVVAAVAAVVAFLPISGRTVLDRWNAAKSPGAFVTKSWTEIKNGTAKLFTDSEPSRKTVERSPKAPKAAPAPAAASRSAPPVEHHSEADRQALDEIVAKHVGK